MRSVIDIGEQSIKGTPGGFGPRSHKEVPVPCDSIQINKVALERMDVGLRRKAIDKLGWRVLSESQTTLQLAAGRIGITVANDQFEVRAGYESLADKLKTAYSREVFLDTAERFNWEYEEVAENDFMVTKESY